MTAAPYIVPPGWSQERTEEAHQIMRGLPDDLKQRFAINWRIPHSLFNVAAGMPDRFPMDRFNDPAARVCWWSIFETRDLGRWSHGGAVYPQAF